MVSVPMPLRGIGNPKNPWHSDHVEYLGPAPPAKLELFNDASRTVLSENDSPDIGFRFSVNPYRGCMHGCSYCYARPTHQYLDMGAGTDFERRLVLKHDAAQLLEQAFERRSWEGETVVFSGVTDCYQPLEASYGLTRACLEVCLRYRNPVGIVTKGVLIERDIDILKRLHNEAHLRINISIPFFDKHKARAVEPWVATPQRRLRTVAALAEAGLNVGVAVAPLIPGLSDEDIPLVLEAAAEAGASRAHFTFLRLPGPVAQVFAERITEAFPMRAEKILRRIREARDGRLNDPRFGNRMRGEGPYAAAAQAMFESHAKRLGLLAPPFEPDDTPTTFRRPTDQLDLFLG